MSLQKEVQSILDAATSKEDGPPGLAFVAIDKQGKHLVSAVSGKKNYNSKEKLDINDVFWLASATKMLTSMAMLHLMDQGKITLDEDISKHLPEYKNRPIRTADGTKSSKTPITLRNLLTHTNGSGHSLFNERLREWTKENKVDEGSGSWEGYSQPLVSEPSSQWEYGAGLDISSRLLTEITGLSLGDYMEENIFKPLGIKDATFDIHKRPEMLERLLDLSMKDKDGKYSNLHDRKTGGFGGLYTNPSFHAGGGGLFMTPSAYCEIIVVLINDGVGSNGTRILKKKTVDLAFEDHLAHLGIPETDLDKPLNSTRLELVAPIPGMPPSGVGKWSPEDKHSWGLLGCLCKTDLITGRKAPSTWWSGVSNTHWWADKETGVGGVIFSQILPFVDLEVFMTWIQAEKAVYDSLQSNNSNVIGKDVEQVRQQLEQL